jgi:hypothetical protein
MFPKSAVTLAFLLSLSVFALATEAVVSPISSQAAENAPTGTLEQIIPGHFMYTNGARMSGVIVTSEGVVVLDALTDEAMAKNERQLIAGTIRQPVRYLISSTFHDNYTGGNVAYQDVIRIGHENYKADLLDMMKTDNVPAAQQAARLPHLTYKDRMTLQLGGKEIQILHVGKAHTRRHLRAWTRAGKLDVRSFCIPASACSFPADSGGCARRRGERNCTRGNRRSGRGRGPTSAVPRLEWIPAAKGDGCAPDVSGP